jgi:hypothetical protein
MRKPIVKAATGLVTVAAACSAAAMVAGGGASASVARAPAQGSTTTTTTAAATSSTTTTTLAPPAQGKGPHKLFMYVDTVTGAGSKPAPAAGCAMTNLFQPGQVVVFRMYGVNVADGGVNLTSATVANAYVKVPGVAAIPMVFGNHGTTSYWTAPWTIAANYPLGIVNFTVHVTTNAVPKTPRHAAVPRESAVFSQAGLAPPSRLTVVKS